MNMTSPKQSVDERFDKQFKSLIFMPMRRKDEIKTFIHQEIALARQEERIELLKQFNSLAADARSAMRSNPKPDKIDEWNSALHQMATKIERLVKLLSPKISS